VKKSKHHTLVGLVRQRFLSKNYYQVVHCEEEYGMARISVQTMLPIMGEVDDYAIHKGKKKYLIVAEVKCNDKPKSRKKAYLQLAKDAQHYKQLYKADRVFAFYCYGDPKDKSWSKITFERVKISELEKVLIR